MTRSISLAIESRIEQRLVELLKVAGGGRPRHVVVVVLVPGDRPVREPAARRVVSQRRTRDQQREADEGDETLAACGHDPATTGRG